MGTDTRVRRNLVQGIRSENDELTIGDTRMNRPQSFPFRRACSCLFCQVVFGLGLGFPVGGMIDA